LAGWSDQEGCLPVVASNWRSAVRITALLSSLASFLFFVLAVEQSGGGSAFTGTAAMDLLVAIYLTLQVIFLVILGWASEPRRR
jgi:hypothetical protein